MIIDLAECYAYARQALIHVLAERVRRSRSFKPLRPPVSTLRRGEPMLLDVAGHEEWRREDFWLAHWRCNAIGVWFGDVSEVRA